MKFSLFIFGFIVAYIFGGRKIAVPYGIAITNNVWLTAALTLTLDLIQIPIFYFIYATGKKISLLRKAKIDAKNRKQKIKHYRLLNWAKKSGSMGIFIVSMLPSFGGGIWSAVLLAFILKTDKRLMYLIITLGSLIGTVILAFAAQGIINFLKIIFI